SRGAVRDLHGHYRRGLHAFGTVGGRAERVGAVGELARVERAAVAAEAEGRAGVAPPGAAVDEEFDLARSPGEDRDPPGDLAGDGLAVDRGGDRDRQRLFAAAAGVGLGPGSGGGDGGRFTAGELLRGADRFGTEGARRESADEADGEDRGGDEEAGEDHARSSTHPSPASVAALPGGRLC